MRNDEDYDVTEIVDAKGNKIKVLKHKTRKRKSKKKRDIVKEKAGG